LKFFKDEIKPAGQIPAAVLELKSKSFDFFNFLFKMLLFDFAKIKITSLSL